MLNNILVQLYELSEALDLVHKDELKDELKSCTDILERYFQIVVREKEYYSITPKEKLNVPMVEAYDTQRRLAHDDCIRACYRLNEICLAVNVDKICNFDVEDRNQVAQFCGYFISSLYFSNIRCDESLNEWLNSCPLNHQT